jgi:hypothetical protein
MVISKGDTQMTAFATHFDAFTAMAAATGSMLSTLGTEADSFDYVTEGLVLTSETVADYEASGWHLRKVEDGVSIMTRNNGSLWAFIAPMIDGRQLVHVSR